MSTTPSPKPPKRTLRPWQRFLKTGDEDLLAFASLYEAELMDKAFYYAQQAIEKYLKAFALKAREAAGLSVAIRRRKRPKDPLITHDIRALVEICRGYQPSFKLPAKAKELAKVTRWETTPRYPSRSWRFSSSDVELVERLAKACRSSLRLRRDYWPLAKGLEFTKPLLVAHTWDQEFRFLRNFAVRPWARSAMSARRIFHDADAIARYSPIIWRTPH